MKKKIIITIMLLMTLVLVGCEEKDEFANTDPIDATMIYCSYTDSNETETNYTLDTKDGIIRTLIREEKITKESQFNRTLEIASSMREELVGIPGINMSYDEQEKTVTVRYEIDYSLLDLEMVNSKVSDYYKEEIFTNKEIKSKEFTNNLKRFGYSCKTK